MLPPTTPSRASHFCHLPSSPVGAGASGLSSSSSGLSSSGLSSSGLSSSLSVISTPQLPSSLFQVKVLSLFLIHFVLAEPSTTSEPSSQVSCQTSTAHSIAPPMTPLRASHFCHLPSSPVGSGASGFSPSGLSSPSSGLSSPSSGFSPSGFSSSGFSPSGPSSSSITMPQLPSSLFHVKVLSWFLIHLAFAEPSTTAEPSSQVS